VRVLEQKYTQNLALIQYHAWWPDSLEVFFVANRPENRARNIYYENTFLPHFFIDGYIDASNDQGDNTWGNMVTERSQTESPLEIVLDIDFDGTEGTVNAHITAEEAIAQAEPVIHFVLTESEIEYQAPNGIPLHHNIMRKMLPDENGEPFTIQVGQTLHLSRDFTLQPDWAPEYCGFVVFIQDNATGEVLQAARSRIHTSLTVSEYTLFDSDGDGDGNFEDGETVNLFLSLMNIGPLASEVSALLSSEDPDVSILTGEAHFQDIPLNGKVDNASVPFAFRVHPNIEAHYTTVSIEVTANGGAVSFQESIEILIGKPDLLVVNDDHLPPTYSWEYDAEGYYRRALNDIGEPYHLWNTKTSDTPEGSLLQEYAIVIWFTNVSETSITPEEQVSLQSYLDAGGGLIISGQDIAADLESSAFLSQFLHARLISDDGGSPVLFGVQNDVISGNVSFLVISGIEGVNRRPDAIAPLSGAVPVFTYSISGEPAAIRYEGAYKVVYFAFGFEGILDFYSIENSPALRADLLQNTLDWLRFEFTPQSGDVNEDGTINVLDVLGVLNIILGIYEPTAGQIWAADVNEDGSIDVLDALGIVHMILGSGESPPGTAKPMITPEAIQYLKSLWSGGIARI
jgi:hypothetical protein